MRKSLPLLVCAFFASMFVFAQTNVNLDSYLKPGHPESYTVIKGDTLWDISGVFLDKPWMWPEVWRINPQIDNPHLIYPGDTIRLVYIDGQASLTLDRGEGGRTFRMAPGANDRGDAGSGYDKQSAKIRSTPLETAIPAIDLDAIQGFIVQNRVVSIGHLEDSPYVVQGDSERLILGAGDSLYVRGELPSSSAYNFVRSGPIYIDPDTQEILGQEATYVGLGRVTSKEGDISTFHVSSTRVEVQIGDRVLPTEERRVETTFYPSAPGTKIDGQLISVFSGVTQIGQYDVVVINRGVREGLEVGNVLAIFKLGAQARDRIANEIIQLPSERAGLLMVFRVFEKMSYGLVMAAETPLRVNDLVKNP
ncbi:MAG: LysM peptidoglycan-binding domain-containing protein [Pseudomonadales bacterium]|nr:LysM peptidoglycan-binding domain-containing protein [Pseudomonadales bacterium]